MSVQESFTFLQQLLLLEVITTFTWTCADIHRTLTKGVYMTDSLD